MSGRYEHLTKISSRVMNQIKSPKHMQERFDKLHRISMPEFLRQERPAVEEAEQYKSEKDWKYLPGDRVVILKGKNKGNICVVKSHDKVTNGYILDDNGPTKTVPVPKEFWVTGQKTHMLNVPIALAQNEIKLVADIDDPKSPGNVKTVAVKDIVFNGSYYDEGYKKVLPYRHVSGMEDLIIPWPRPEINESVETLGTDPEIAREQTFWVDSVIKNPIPENAFLTIRNPYSKYRRDTLTVKDIAKLVAPKMPLTETKKAYLRDRQELSQKRRPRLTETEKDKIGETVYQHISQKTL